MEATEGKILIDGVDISKIGLTDLRSKITIIPRESPGILPVLNGTLTFRAEDPTILSGTLRSALDVFDEYEDANIVGDIIVFFHSRG